MLKLKCTENEAFTCNAPLYKSSLGGNPKDNTANNKTEFKEPGFHMLVYETTLYFLAIVLDQCYFALIEQNNSFHYQC